METKKTIYQKIAEVKKEIGTIKKDKTNKFFNNAPYFDINQLIEAVEPLLEKQSLILLQPITNGCVKTIIFDITTNEQIESELKLPDEINPQKIGSAITYYRRYTLQSLLSLQAEDDDGNKASNNKPTSNIKPPISTEAGTITEWMTEAIYKNYLKRIEEAEIVFDMEDISKELKEWQIAPKGLKKEYKINLLTKFNNKTLK